MPNGYCFAHQAQAPDANPFYKKTAFKIGSAIGTSVLAVIGIWLTLHFGWLGSTKEGQDKTHANQAEQQQTAEETRRLAKANNRLLNQMAVAEEVQKDEFLLRYDLGYCLIAINHQRRTVSTPKESIGGYKIDWSPFRVLEYVPYNKVTLSSPSVRTQNNVKFRSHTTTLSTKQNKPFQIWGGQVNGYVEIVSETTEGIVAVFGLSSIPYPNERR